MPSCCLVAIRTTTTPAASFGIRERGARRGRTRCVMPCTCVADRGRGSSRTMTSSGGRGERHTTSNMANHPQVFIPSQMLSPLRSAPAFPMPCSSCFSLFSASLSYFKLHASGMWSSSACQRVWWRRFERRAHFANKVRRPNPALVHPAADALQVTDQEWKGGNLALQNNMKTGTPVRVIRGKVRL